MRKVAAGLIALGVLLLLFTLGLRLWFSANYYRLISGPYPSLGSWGAQLIIFGTPVLVGSGLILAGLLLFLSDFVARRAERRQDL